MESLGAAGAELSQCRCSGDLPPCRRGSGDLGPAIVGALDQVIFVRSATGGSARRIAASKTLVASLPLANPYAHTLGGSPWLNENETSCVVDSSATRWVDEGQAVLDDGRVL